MGLTIHPFPARMAPGLALRALEELKADSVVVDPMVGSGTVVREAGALGLRAYGFDLDPLAVLISRVWTTNVSDELVARTYSDLRQAALAADPEEVCLSWMDSDEETSAFVSYWFGRKQARELRCWAYAIASHEADTTSDVQKAIDVVKVALSRIIVTKEQTASLARDTSHSRPHKVADDSDYSVFIGMERSIKGLRDRIRGVVLPRESVVQIGDARSIPMDDNCADAVLTSPPYLNAIDYIRGHRLSLIWLGYKLSELRKIRANSIGAERAPDDNDNALSEIQGHLGDLSKLPRRYQLMIDRYCIDLLRMSKEICRILRPHGVATLVVGNSCLKEIFIKNSSAVEAAMQFSGLAMVEQLERELPNRNRYLPTSDGSALSKRMRTESVMRFMKY